MKIPAAYRSARGLVLPDDGADHKFRIYFLRFRPDYFRMVKLIDDIRHSCTKILRMPGQHNFYENMTESDNQPAINSLCFRGRQIIIKYSVLLPPGGYMVHIDLCTKEGVMKAYAFQTPMQAMTLLDTIKDDEFQWFNLEWDGQRFTCPYHFIKRLSSRSYIRSFWR